MSAQRAADFGWAAPIELNSKNYLAAGDSTNYTGYGTNRLKNHDTNLWQSVTNAFRRWDRDYVRVLITPGPVTNNTGSYKGMGALMLVKGGFSALISANQTVLNGGWGSVQPTMLFGVIRTDGTLVFTLISGADGTLFFNYNDGAAFPQSFFSPTDALLMGDSDYLWSPVQQNQVIGTALILNLPSGSGLMPTINAGENFGVIGQPDNTQGFWSFIADPVNTLNGEFYVNATDLTLPGPMPLQLSRNYLSRNFADNHFGFGWKMNFTPFLVVTTNAANQEIIYAAELEGSVIAYRKQTNDVWLVVPEDNPSLNNNSIEGIGSSANRFNARLERYATNGGTYILRTADGGKRYYQLTNYTILGGGTNISRTRPYLVRAEDHAGNYHRFLYGTNSTANDYGQVNRIESANGNFLGLCYDFYGRVIEAFTGDGRRVTYEYDDFGDLVTVTLPDSSAAKYEYEHISFSTTNGMKFDSTHRITREIKPDGRIVQNAYDSLGRVTNQAATVGTDLNLVTNAVFIYSNNLTNVTNTVISGTTYVLDYLGRTNSIYRYTNIRVTTAGDVRSGGGSVILAPEPTRAGTINPIHVNISQGSGPTVFGPPVPNPVPRSQRVQ